jgi:hypothetical protein
MESPVLTLFSNSLMGKYVLVRSYDLSHKVPSNFEYLYDHNLPTYDYIQKENRKKIKVMCLSTGNHEVHYESHVIYLNVEVPFEHAPLVDKMHSDIIYKITLRLAGCPSPEHAKTILIDICITSASFNTVLISPTAIPINKFNIITHIMQMNKVYMT